MKIGFIGLGTMGGRMATSLRAAGHELYVNDIRAAQLTPHVAAGAIALGVWSGAASATLPALLLVSTLRIASAFRLGTTSAIPGKLRGSISSINPARFSRERKLGNCALCHSGMRELKRPSFSYKPGERLEDFLMPATTATNPTPDVHG